MTTFPDLSAPLPPLPSPKRGRRSYEDLVYYQLRLGRMTYLFIKGLSYRAIAKDLGISHTTVLRMKPYAAQFSAYTDRFGAIIAVPSGRTSGSGGMVEETTVANPPARPKDAA